MIRRDPESGAYLILYVLLATAFFALAAMVLDITALREDRAADRLAADLAVTAGAAELSTTDAVQIVAACQTAWEYFLVNRDDATVDAAPDCSSAFGLEQCSSATGLRTAVGTAGPYQVEISNPVPDSSDLMQGEQLLGDVPQAVDPVIDGTPCQRLAVRVLRERDLGFAGIVGLTRATTNVHSVARVDLEATSARLTEMVLLERTGCSVLTTTSDGGSLLVQGNGQTGDIAVDSDASGCVGEFVINVGDPATVKAIDTSGLPGIIRSYALSQPAFGAAYDPTDVAALRLVPEPSPALVRTTRAFVDNRYNCPACNRNHIGELRAALGGSGPPLVYDGLAFATYTGVCDVVAPLVVPAGNWFVDCPDFRVNSSATFLGGTVVFAGNVSVGPGGCLAVNDTGCGATGVITQDSIVYVRAGNFAKQDTGQLHLNRTFVHVTGSAASTDGAVLIGPDFAGGNSVLRWSAPFGGRFEDLLVWAESGAAMTLGGQGTMVMDGAFFTPNAPLTLAPRPGGTAAAAQIIARTARLQGAHPFTITPAASRGVTDTVAAVRLLR